MKPKPIVKRQDGLVVWELVFKKGDKMEDVFPPKNSPFHDKVSVGDWVVKNTIFFVEQGEFILTDVEGNQYHLTDQTHPRTATPALDFSYECLSSFGVVVCISSDSAANPIQADAERIVSTHYSEYSIDVENDYVGLYVNSGMISHNQIVLEKGLTKLPNNSSVLLKSHTTCNFVIIKNIRPYVFEILEETPQYAKDRLIS